jgi:hypothetical protein
LASGAPKATKVITPSALYNPSKVIAPLRETQDLEKEQRKKKEGQKKGSSALLVWLISHQPAVLFSHNKPATSNQPAVRFLSEQISTSHQPNGQTVGTERRIVFIHQM